MTGEPHNRVEYPSGAGHQSLADRLLATSHDYALRLPPDVREIDHGTLLYSENGLPRSG